MRKIGLLLIAAVALMVIGCQPPEAGVTPDQINELKTHIDGLKTDVGNLQMAVDSLTTLYNMHVEKWHKGGAMAPKTSTPPPRTGAK